MLQGGDVDSAEVLREILVRAPTTSAGTSALVTLRALAQHDTDFEAIRALGKTLALELGYDNVVPSYDSVSSLPDLFAKADIPPLLRVYAGGFSLQDLIRHIEVCAKLASQVSATEDFSRFQHLVRRSSLLQHEGLRAYVLASFLNMASPGSVLWDTLGSPGVFKSVLERIYTESRVVPGEAAETGLTVGRDLIVSLPSVDAFLTVLYHEFGHLVQDAIYAGRTGSSGLINPDNPEDERLFLEIARSLPGLETAARSQLSQAFEPEDQRILQTNAGIQILYSQVELPRGRYTHVSLSDRGGLIDLQQAAICSYFILSTLDVDPRQAVAAYSPGGIFHLAFLGTGPDAELLQKRLRSFDVRPLLENLRANAVRWVDELEKSGRLGDSEADLRSMLGLEERQASYYGPDPDVVSQDLEICEQLRAGAQISRDILNRLLCSAVRCADLPVVEALLGAGADPNAHIEGSDKPCVLYTGSSLCIIDYGTERVYYGSSASNIFAVIEILHSFGVELNVPIDSDENTLLIDAAKRSLELTRFLLAHGAAVNKANRHGETPLVIAASLGPSEVVEKLLDSGAQQVRDNGGNTPLHAAVERGHETIIRLLIEHGADVDAANQEGQTPIMAARSAAITRLLSKAGATVSAATTDGWTALMFAAHKGLPDVLRELLGLGADYSAATTLGETAMHFAVFPRKGESQCENLEILLGVGMDIDEETNEGNTPLMFAAAFGHVEAVEFLIARGANINARSFNGDTAFVWAARPLPESHRDPTRYSRSQEVIQILAKAGADVNAADEFGFTALHYATLGFDGSAVQTLLEVGASTNVRTRDSVTPLAQAVAQEHSFMVQTLIEAGADVNAADSEGNTPLHVALGSRSENIIIPWHADFRSSSESNSAIVQQLLRAGADVYRSNTRGNSPLTLANGNDVNQDSRQMILDAAAASTEDGR